MPEDNNFEKENQITNSSCEEISQEEELSAENEGDIKNPPDFTALFSNIKTDESFYEKLSIKKSAKAIGLGFLLMQGLILALNTIILTADFVLKASGVGDIGLLSDPMITETQQILFSILSFTLPFIISFKIFSIRISDLISFAKPEKSTVLPCFLFGIGFCSFANIVSSIAGGIFSSFGIEYNVDFPEGPKGILGFIISVIATVITPALVEEFACRGLVLGHLKKYGEGFAIIVSAILFGLVHSNFEQIPFAFLVGLVLGFITVKSGSIWPAVIVHAYNNFISIAFDYLLSAFSSQTQNIIYTIFLIINLLVGIIGVLLLKEKNEAYSLAPSDYKLLEKEKYKLFFKNGLIVIFIVICLAESLAFFVV